MKPLKRVVIKEELVELTGDYRPAIILNQFLYWSERMYNVDDYIREEKERAVKSDLEVSLSETHGWIYKTSEDLAEELMTGMSIATIRKYIKQLVELGFIHERTNPKHKWDKTKQYRVDLYKVQLELGKLGYGLDGYKMLPGIQIVEVVEESNEIIENEVPCEEERPTDLYEKIKNTKEYQDIYKLQTWIISNFEELDEETKMKLILKEAQDSRTKFITPIK